jgi:arylsulfatase A-like enzyme
MQSWRWFASLVAVVFVVGCTAAPFEPARNLILISIDTLRADRLGSYGYARPTSPGMDALAAGGVRFERMLAESSWTLPSHMTLLTGLHARGHGVTRPGRRLADEIPTLAETLRSAGFRTYAYTEGGFVHERFGFARGFDAYKDARRNFASVLSGARKRIRTFGPEDRWFLFLHTYDVHCPYTPPPAMAEHFRTRSKEDQLAVPEACGAGEFDKLGLTPEQVGAVSDLYDAGIRAADDRLARFLTFLDEQGHRDDTAIVLVSDHGEDLGDHGSIGHRTLHAEVLRVPFIVAAPGLAPRVVAQGVGMVDVFPTLLELVGVDPAQAAPLVPGRSLLALMRGVRSPARPVFSEVDVDVPMRSVLVDDVHQIHYPEQGRSERYDWRHDPMELEPLAPDTDLARILNNHAESQAPARAGKGRGPTPEERERLRALGYAE